MRHETVLIIDFGGRYKQMIARRIREQQVYCEVWPSTTDIEVLWEKDPKAIVFTGGPNSVNNEDAPAIDVSIFDWDIPVLGIGYGAQLMATLLGGKVGKPQKREDGEIKIKFDTSAALFQSLREANTVWMSPGDWIEELPAGFTATASTEYCPIAALEDPERKLYGVLFHPEVKHTLQGDLMIAHFLFDIAKLKGDWQMDTFVKSQVEKIRAKVGNKKVISAMSGGVDSSVSSLLVHRAIGKNLTCILVDHGLMRKNEANDVERIFRKKFSMNLIRVDAKDRFLKRLEGVADPETKRKIIGEEFIRVFEEEAKKIGGADFLVQGTIYPDVIESGGDDATVIKSHHNVGGLPDDVEFSGIIEPLRELFKDEVRQVGIELGIPEDLVWRQPFPGPGLAIRIMGEITERRLDIVREADAIFREEIARASLARDIGQYFAVLTGVRSVGVSKGDERTYDYAIALRAVTTTDFMTADWAKIPYDILDRISKRIINEVDGVNRVVYDITGKPPATIEWE